MDLVAYQMLFTKMVAGLIMQAQALGLGITLGEVYRPPEIAGCYERRGKGISNSLHTLSLAVDIRLYKEGKYQKKSEEYRALGEYWESQGGSWGGRFGDGGHFSLSYKGRQ